MGEVKEFLQSTEWLRFQEATGKETAPFAGEGFLANGIVHQLSLVGKYLYIPRGPQTNSTYQTANIKKDIGQLVQRAEEKKMKWLRIEPESEDVLEEIRKVVVTLRQAQGGNLRVTKAPHDMQPREIFKTAITKTEDELLQAMKSKTRYNIRLAERHGVTVVVTREQKYQEAFLDLITATSGRKKITAHTRAHYKAFFSALPEDMCQLFVAEYQDQILAANLVLFYSDTVIYLHGGSSDAHRDVMAPFLLQWATIKYAKAHGYHFYDFGGIKTVNNQQLAINEKRGIQSVSDWSGITKFKLGFSPQTPPTVYPGTYDIVLDAKAYSVYDMLRRFRALMVTLKKKCS